MSDFISYIKSIVRRIFFPRSNAYQKLVFPPEITDSDCALISRLLSRDSPNAKLTLLSLERLVAISKAADYISSRNIPGDFVECGVWRGGASILLAHKLREYSLCKKLYMYDTYAGMSQPSSYDVNTSTGKSALPTFLSSSRDTHNDWCFASIDDVSFNLNSFGLSEYIRLIAGPVERTLIDPPNLPTQISLLRLDTDWYESTRVELEVLYPLVAPGGVVLIDDYGHWDGARKAVDEFLASLPSSHQPLMWITDRSGRGFVKPNSLV